MEKQLLFSGNSNKELAESVAKNLGKKLAPIKVSTFSDGEVNVEIDINVRGSDTFIIQSTDSPAEKNLMELVLIADALKRLQQAQSLPSFLILAMPDKTDE